MKAFARAVATVVIILAAGTAIDRFCVHPLRCSILERRVELRTAQLVDFQGGVSVAGHARENLDTVDECLRSLPNDINLYMIAAVNYRLLGDNKTAVRFYEKALRYDQRPELFMNLGNAQAALGQRREAIENLLKANIFWPGNGDEIEDPFVHDEVVRRVQEYESAIKKRR